MISEQLAVPPRLERLFGAWDAAGIRWSLLRPVESLGQWEGDVDLLVQPGDLERARAVVAAQGFREMEAGALDHHAVDYDVEARRWLWIHVQTELRLADARVPAARILAVSEGSPHLPDEWLLWILLLRALVEKGTVAPRHRAQVSALAERASGPPPELEQIAQRYGLATAEVGGLAATADWAALERLALPQPNPEPRRSLVSLVRRARRLTGQPGLSVAVIGPDGAGKTTLVESLQQRLPFPTRVQYMGLTGGQIPRAERLRIPGIVLAGKLVILWGRYFRTAYHRRSGRIVLIDRYTLDGAVPSGIRLRPAARVSRRVLLRACPLPDLVLLLDASGATMYRRKGEYDAETLELWRKRYATLVGVVSQLELLDAEQPAELVRRDAEATIWRHFRRRLDGGPA